MAPLQPVSKLKGFFGLLLLSGLAACGGGGDSGPGTTGDTGVRLTATMVPRYHDANFYSVDVIQQVCDPGPPPVFEVFTDHSARVTISASLIDPLTVSPGTLVVDKYTIVYQRATDSIGAPPILSDTRYEVITIVPPTGTGTSTTTVDVIFLDLLRKARYLNDINSGLYTSNPPNILNNYTAIYTFSGQNQYGREFSFTVQTPFQIGSFDYCDV